MFGDRLDVDRDRFATNIAAYVVNHIKPDANARQMENARRFLGLALHLNPRNRTAVVANFQFKRGLDEVAAGHRRPAAP